MKKMDVRNAAFLLLALCLLGACGRKEVKQEEVTVVESPAPKVVTEEVDEGLVELDQRYQEVMRIHDQAMERMSEIRHLSRQLEDSIANTNVNPMEQEETINNYRNRLKALNQADQAMRLWMREFDYSTEMSRAEKLRYLAEEEDKIKQVNRQINEAIGNTRQSLRP